jgi:UDP-2-acetamido-3-amino-2,3-dideoxy-glucuronate N-acetyltransferase
MLDRKLERAYTVHESAYIDEPCTIGEGTKIWHFSHIMRHATIGRHCTIGQNVLIGPNVRIGNNVKIQNNVSVYEGVELEDDVFCGPSIVFTNVATPRCGVPRNTTADYRRTLVRRGATIGANATIVCGTTIGAFAFVGAGAVITKDVPDHALVYGNPARLHGYACECGVKLLFEDTAGTCPACRRLYRRSGENVREVVS